MLTSSFELRKDTGEEERLWQQERESREERGNDIVIPDHRCLEDRHAL